MEIVGGALAKQLVLESKCRFQRADANREWNLVSPAPESGMRSFKATNSDSMSEIRTTRSAFEQNWNCFGRTFQVSSGNRWRFGEATGLEADATLPLSGEDDDAAAASAVVTAVVVAG